MLRSYKAAAILTLVILATVLVAWGCSDDSGWSGSGSGAGFDYYGESTLAERIVFIHIVRAPIQVG